MQGFINHERLERGAAEIFSGGRSRYYLLSLIAVATGTAGGLALAAIWLGLMLLVDETRKALAAHVTDEPANLALDVAGTAAFAAAPAIVWFSRADLAAPLAISMLGALMVTAALSERRSALRALAAASPFCLLAFVFVLDAAFAQEVTTAAACALTTIFAFAFALQHVHLDLRAQAHAAAENEALVLQMNMALRDSGGAAWEIDFSRKTMLGGERLGAVLGRAVDYETVVDAGCFATLADLALARAAFSPGPGAFSRIALEHAAVDGDGAAIRLRHEGVVRTTPEGAPRRLTCVTRRVDRDTVHESDHAAVEAMREAARSAGAMLATQGELLKSLSNELAKPLDAAVAAAPNAVAPDAPFDVACNSIADLLKALAEREGEIERFVDELTHARHAAESANLTKSQFLANMSHELRTPLNAIIGYAEILQEDAEDENNAQQMQDLQRILTAARHLLMLLNEILDLSKIEAGRMDVSVTPFEPGDLLDELIDTARPLAEKNRNLIAWVNERPEGLATTDQMKLRQCLLNFLSNACKFTKDGKIDVLYERRMESGVDQLFFTVRDTGIGMSPEQLSRLFQPFVQADPSITQQYGGTGLGLTITRRLAQLLGGDVSVESKMGQGSAFRLRVPASYNSVAALLGASAEIDPLQGAAEAPLVIVIEDEPDARDLAARALTRAGFAVQGVGGGEAGLTLARTKKPALVLLDIFLPDRSGWRVLQSLKHDPKTSDIPVVVLSVNEDRAHALSLGAAEHIVKPADRDMLAATVMRFARKRPVTAEAASAPVADIKKIAG